MKKIIYTLFILPLFFSCAKNGEYKVCNDDIEFESDIMLENPNSDICYIDSFKDDHVVWSKVYVDDILMKEEYLNKHIKISYNKKGDTIYHNKYVKGEYNYSLSQKVGEKDEYLGYEIRVDYENRADISELLYEYDKDDKLILRKTHCKDKKGNFCECPNDKTDKFLTKFHNERALEKQRRNANTNFLGRQ